MPCGGGLQTNRFQGKKKPGDSRADSDLLLQHAG